MKIFSLSGGGHDSSYAIYDGKKIILHDEIERHSRIKEDNASSLEFYQNSGGNLDDFDILTFYPPGHDKLFHTIKDLDNFIEVGHHQSHAANAFFSSNLEQSLIITIDGGGADRIDGKIKASEITIWSGEGNKVHSIKYFFGPYNLGMAWNRITNRVFGLSGGGPPYGSQAGTVMAMSAFGDKNAFSELDTSIFLSPDVGYTNLSEKQKFDFAARLQHLTEIFIKQLIGEFIGDNKNLCLSGGVVLNSVMTGKIWDWYPQLENIYIPPVPYDAGLAIGNIQYILHHMMDKPREKYCDNFTPYLGRTYSNEEIFSAIEKLSDKIEYQSVTDEEVVKLLIEQDIVSVFNGGSESGRRALGNRSILADPRSSNMKDIINEKVKHRQPFRPFAPSIMRDKVSEWFVRDIDSPYMQFVLKFKDGVKDKVPAVVHYDGTARLQTVTENDNKWYYNFIKKFYNSTGVPMLLNTSFNDREPIVETPEHAIHCYLKTNIDYLYFSDPKVLISKKQDVNQ